MVGNRSHKPWQVGGGAKEVRGACGDNEKNEKVAYRAPLVPAGRDLLVGSKIRDLRPWVMPARQARL